jgi:voltage-gated potassium channel
MSDAKFGQGHNVGAFQLGLLGLTILLLCGLVADTVLDLPKEVSNLVHLFDTLACALFFADFCYRFYRAESKVQFMKWGWIDLIASIPNLQILRYGRLVRVLRVIRLLRGIRSVQLVLDAVFHQKLRTGAASVVFSAILLVGFSSLSILICERRPDANIKTAEDALWWSVATITTVGYGDKYPVTTEGRAIGIVLMLGGVTMFGCISGLAATFFLGGRRANDSDMRQVLARLEQLDAKLSALNGKDAGETGTAKGPISDK